jgi:Xaa-Pro dipeptidase
LRKHLEREQLDGVALVPGPNMLYFTGITSHVSERPIILLLPSNAEPAIIIPTLEAMKARDAGLDDARIYDWSDQSGYDAAFTAASADLQLAEWKLGVEKFYMRVFESDLLRHYAPGIQITPAEPFIYALRAIKDESEIAAMERAVTVAERAMAALLPNIKSGMTEKQVAGLLTQQLFDHGADSIAFGPIVASGPNSASPHAYPTERPLQRGDLVVIDWGVFVDDYPSDITRTFAIGSLSAEFKNIYETVQRANQAGKEAARPGATGQDVDRAARRVIEDAGYGEAFSHRTGHGLGLEVHELPNMVEGNDTPLEVGNLFTVEPGIYLAGLGGVRIEDDVVITADGFRSLTTFPRELITIGDD